MFLSRNQKNNVYPCKPQFYYIKVRFISVCFRDENNIFGAMLRDFGISWLCSLIFLPYMQPASVAQLDARPTGNQMVEGSTLPARYHSFVEIDHEIFYGHSLPSNDSVIILSCWSWEFLWSFSPFRWFKKGSCQFLAKKCAQYWLTV